MAGREDCLCDVQGCSPTVKDRDGCTPLYCAAAWNRMEAVRELERLGSQAGVRSLEGRTPVHVAAEQVPYQKPPHQWLSSPFISCQAPLLCVFLPFLVST